MMDINLDQMAKWLLMKMDECGCGHYKDDHLKLADRVNICNGCLHRDPTGGITCEYEPTGEEFVNLLTQLVAGNEEETAFALGVLDKVVEQYRNLPRS